MGYVYSSSRAPGCGQHGSMSRHEMLGILFARGPRFKQSIVLDSPSGNVDVAPTILRILGITTAEAMDGRPLSEALDGGPNNNSVDRSTKVYKAERRVDGGVYQQQITVSRVGSTTYVDDGFASLDPY